MTKTYREIMAFINAAVPYLEAHQKTSKFRYAIKKVLKTCQAQWQTYSDQIQDLDIEHCATDKDGVILTDDRGAARFTKDGLKARNKARSVLIDSSVEVVPFLREPESTDEVTEAEREAFSGFVMTEHEDAE